MHRLDLFRGRGQAAADGPNRLIGHRKGAAARGLAARTPPPGGRPRPPPGRSAAPQESRRRRRWAQDPRRPRPWPWPPLQRFAHHASLVARSGRRSPGVAPASTSISAEMSPVKAPDFRTAILSADFDTGPAKRFGHPTDQGRRRTERHAGGDRVVIQPGRDRSRLDERRPPDHSFSSCRQMSVRGAVNGGSPVEP